MRSLRLILALFVALNCDQQTVPSTATIAGHSSITMTQRYVHPQDDAIERAFAKVGGHKIGHNQMQSVPYPSVSS
jgi:hypothetical protein